MDNKQKILDSLRETNILYDVIDHSPVFTIDEMLALNLPQASQIAKNLFIRDDKKRNYYLFVLQEEKRINLKQMREKINSRPLTFASENDLANLLGLTKGAVTPFGVINDESHQVKVYIDTEFRNTTIGVHPNVNTATVWLQTCDLMRFIEQQGNFIEFLEF